MNVIRCRESVFLLDTSAHVLSAAQSSKAKESKGKQSKAKRSKASRWCMHGRCERIEVKDSRTSTRSTIALPFLYPIMNVLLYARTYV